MACQSPNLPKPAAFTRKVTRGPLGGQKGAQALYGLRIGEVCGEGTSRCVKGGRHGVQGRLIPGYEPQFVGHLQVVQLTGELTSEAGGGTRDEGDALGSGWHGRCGCVFRFRGFHEGTPLRQWMDSRYQPRRLGARGLGKPLQLCGPDNSLEGTVEASARSWFPREDDCTTPRKGAPFPWLLKK